MKLISALLAAALIAGAAAGRAFRAAASATIAGRVLDAQTGRRIPCTVAIHTSQDSVITESPSFAAGFRSDGEFEKAVPPGETIITVSRGFDYVAQQRRVELRPRQRIQLVFRLRRQANLRGRGWYCGDSHIHMIHGERQVPVSFAEVALAGRAAGLDYMSIAQNWNLPPAETTPARLNSICAKLSTPDFIFTWNMEEPKNYWRGDVSHCLGHCWTLAMRGYTPDGRDAIQELFRMSAHDYESDKTPTPNFESHILVHSLGGIVAYSHPCRWWWGTWGGEGGYPVEQGKFISNLAQELPYDTIAGPTYDAIDILMQAWDRPAYLEAQRLWFMLLNHGYRIAGTASTDSAFDNPGAAHPGAVRVYTHADGPPSIPAVARAMKTGSNFVTSGPLLLLKIGRHTAGSVIRVDGPANFQAQLEAWPSGKLGERLTRVELIRDGEVVKTFSVGSGRGEVVARFGIHENGTAWYVARCFGSNDLQVAITDPVYFQRPDYRPPRATPAHVTAQVESKAGVPLSGECEVIRMVGLNPEVVSVRRFTGGGFTIDVPATARLRVRVRGYVPMMQSIFMDDAALLRMTLNMREAEITDWRTFEEIKRLLGNVQLQFHLAPAIARKDPPRSLLNRSAAIQATIRAGSPRCHRF
ncbi:MAG: CehA/McbA family metallohydrolase [Terriglobia bacterium]